MNDRGECVESGGQLIRGIRFGLVGRRFAAVATRRVTGAPVTCISLGI